MRFAASRKEGRRWIPRWCGNWSPGAARSTSSHRGSARCSSSWPRAARTAGIAEALFVTESAIEKHVSQIFTKLQLTPADSDHRRVLAVLAYLRATG